MYYYVLIVYYIIYTQVQYIYYDEFRTVNLCPHSLLGTITI